MHITVITKLDRAIQLTAPYMYFYNTDAEVMGSAECFSPKLNEMLLQA